MEVKFSVQMQRWNGSLQMTFTISFFQLGINAKNRSDFEDTKSLFKKELARAKESSVTQRDVALYAGELNRLNSMTQKEKTKKANKLNLLAFSIGTYLKLRLPKIPEL
jgi:hypothetical protein